MKRIFTVSKLVLTSMFLLIVILSKSQQMPPLQVINSDSVAAQGYYFLSPYTLTPPYNYSHPQLILDSYGNPVYYKEYSLTGTTAGFTLHQNGLMSYFEPLQSAFYLMDSTFNVVDSIKGVNEFDADTHELQFLPDSGYMILAKEVRTMNLFSYLWFGINHDQHGSINADVTGSVIQRFDKNKNLIFEWRAHDHFDFADVDSVWLNSPSTVDWTHSNALELDSDGNILLSSRHLNEITKINSLTGDIIWRFGGKNNQFVFTNDTIGFTGQHDIRRISNGNITIWNNGQYTDPPVGRAIEYSLDETNKIASIQWQYIHDPSMFSGAMGNHQELSNGRRLVNFGFIEPQYPMMVLINPDCTLVTQIYGPENYANYRAFYYDTLPWLLPRPQISCSQNGDDYYLTADPGYPFYQWTNGQNTQSVLIDQTGSYQVFIPFGNGGMLGSEIVTITDLVSPCENLVSNCTVTSFPWSQDFENGGNIPVCWTQEFENTSLNWSYQNGGYGGHPASAHGGSYNAFLYIGTTTPNITKLVSPPLNLSALSNPALTFWHTQELWSPDQDELRIYYKTTTGGAWTLLQTYTNNITTWTQETINLPNPTGTYYIAFEGTAKYGYGICLDDVTVNGTTTSPPVANFSANSITPYIGQTVTFTDLSTNSPTSWSWSFSPATISYIGGTSSSSQNPQVQFNAGGLYTVTLIAANAYGSDLETKTDYISTTSLVIDLELTLLLEGPFDGVQMTPSLNGILPLNQPYNAPPWNYSGTESVSAIPNPNVVDWILVELRDAATAALATGTTAIARQAAFLQSDGTVTGMDGLPGLHFTTTVSNNLFVVVFHRNHLSIMSSVPLTTSGGVYTYNFFTGAGQVYGGTDGHKELQMGYWGLTGGDGDHNGAIGTTDYSPVWEDEAGQSGYPDSDYNLDMQSDNIDKDEIWMPNIGKSTQVPD